MKFWAIKQNGALYPDGDESLAEFDRLPIGKPLQIEATQPRSGPHHRLFFKLCSRIGTGIGKPTEWVERAFKLEMGYFDLFRYAGKEVPILRSISFAEMDQTAFKEFFERAIQIMYETWGIDPASVADLLTPGESQKHG